MPRPASAPVPDPLSLIPPAEAPPRTGTAPNPGMPAEMSAEVPGVKERPGLLIGLGWYAILGCAAFAVSILIADLVVPNHDWIADTISDLAAGRYRFIVDIGLYAFASALIGIALLAAHAHLGGWGWSTGMLAFALLGLIVFMVGARDEYGDGDREGIVIHVYLVYAIGLLVAVAPLAMARGASRAGVGHGRMLTAIALLWIPSAPLFFVMPDSIDGLYERYLGLLAMAAVVTLARLFIQRGHRLRGLPTRKA